MTFTMISVLVFLCLLQAVTAFTSSPQVGHRPAVTTTRTPFVSTVYTPKLQQPQQQQKQQRQKDSHVLCMGWGPDPIWTSAKVKSNQAACESGACVKIWLEVPAETAAEYKIPGQYVQVRLDEETKPLFLAIASPPDAENAAFEFLIKKTEGNEWMTSIAEGTPLEISQVLGNGFAIEDNLEGFKYDFPTQNILLFAAGSGIAPIKAAAESGQLQLSDARKARLYYGERTASDLCYVDLFSTWEKAGIQVVPVLSQPSPDWEGRTGYVQTALTEDGIPIPRNSGSLICGMKGMAEAVKDLLTKAGVFEGRVLFNF